MLIGAQRLNPTGYSFIYLCYNWFLIYWCTPILKGTVGWHNRRKKSVHLEEACGIKIKKVFSAQNFILIHNLNSLVCTIHECTMNEMAFLWNSCVSDSNYLLSMR